MQRITTTTPSKSTRGWMTWIVIDGKESIAIIHPDAHRAALRASTIVGMLHDALANNDHLEF